MKKIIITGRLGQDVEVKSANDKQFFTGSIATEAGNKQNPKTEWTSLIGDYERFKNLIPFLKKGTNLLVIGKPNAESYTNKNNEHVATLKVSVNEIELLGGGKDREPEELTLTSDDLPPF